MLMMLMKLEHLQWNLINILMTTQIALTLLDAKIDLIQLFSYKIISKLNIVFFKKTISEIIIRLYI